MIDDDCPQFRLLLVAECLVLLEAVERGDCPLGNERVASLAHAGPGPSGQPRQTKPQRTIDPVVIETFDALVHDHIGARPGSEALAEYEHLWSVLLRHSNQSLLDTPEKLAKLGATERNPLNLQE